MVRFKVFQFLRVIIWVNSVILSTSIYMAFYQVYHNHYLHRQILQTRA